MKLLFSYIFIHTVINTVKMYPMCPLHSNLTPVISLLTPDYTDYNSHLYTVTTVKIVKTATLKKYFT